MADVKYDVLGIGNALFDVLVRTDEAFLAKHGMTKGSMSLIDEARAAAIYKDMGPATEVSGGSAANTIVGIGSLGARAAYVGKVKDDQIGKLYVHDIRSAGVAFNTPAAQDGPATGCSYILVTDDGERTMNTYLGAAQDLSPADIDPAEIAAAGIVYLEGYLWDPKNAKDAFVKAAKIAHDAKRKVALTLSDSFCVDRYRDEFLSLMRKRHGRHRLRQRVRAAFALHDLGFRHSAEAAAQRRQSRRGHPQREGLRGGDTDRRCRSSGLTGHETGGHHRRRRSLCGGLPLRPFA
ncbi:sugar/nucleoside kinase (ribokinase family) [Bradyrhizobium ottawaense]